MKQMSLIEMDGFLKGKCIPRDLKVNETNAEYLVRKFGELESKLETALRECRSAGITIDNLEAKCAALAAENAGIKSAIPESRDIEDDNDNMDDVSLAEDFGFNHAIERMRRQIPETPTTDAFLAEVRAQGVEMYADNLDNGADDAERCGFDYAVKFLRSEASGVRLFADQLRKGGNQ
ncbi:hypothetical protein MID48_002989 [Escherichia coli]|nr:hypothetical protein [Escherichia coli]